MWRGGLIRTGLPCSCVSIVAKEAVWASRASAKARTAFTRSVYWTFDQDTKALLAAATASSTSCWVATGTAGLGWPVAGFIPFLVSLEEIIFPLMVLKKPVETSNLAMIEGMVIIMGAAQASTLPFRLERVTSDELYP